MHAKTDSDVTSLPESSPARSPARRGAAAPVYYVQSPSRDSTSHDGEKTNNSFHSTPDAISPMGSPPHSHSNSSSLGPTSRESSSTRFDKAAGGKGRGGAGGRHGGGGKDHGRRHHHHPFDAIEEESLLSGDDDQKDGGVPRRCCYFIGFVVAFFLLFSFFSLVLWGASRNQKPIITMKSIKFEEFEIQAGQDASGVPTAMSSMNVTVKLVYQNKGTFFGVHVTSTPLLLSFQDLLLASGNMNYFYESRKSRRQVTVQLKGDRVPLYGGGYTLSSSNKEAPIFPVPLTLNFRVRSRAYVLGRVVKPKFYKGINCQVVMDPKKMNVPMSLRNNCTYTST